jgi:hypothetical protein
VVAAANPEAVARMLMATCLADRRGVHVAEWSPAVPLTGDSLSGGSPLLKVATTAPSPTAAPQSLDVAEIGIQASSKVGSGGADDVNIAVQ